MIVLSEVKNEILLFAPSLFGQVLQSQLSNDSPNLKVVLTPEELTRDPSLIIWSLESLEVQVTVQIELRKLEEYWHPSPVLLILPSKTNLTSQELLQFGCTGLLQDPTIDILSESINTLIKGGRVLRLNNKNVARPNSYQKPIGIGEWLLISGLRQINQDLDSIETLLSYKSNNLIIDQLLKGRKRELIAAQFLLIKIWGPLKSRVNSNSIESYLKESKSKPDQSITNLLLQSRDSESIWLLLRDRILASIENNSIDKTGNLLAIGSLNSTRKKELFISIHNQLDKVLSSFLDDKYNGIIIRKEWLSLQSEIRQESIRLMTGSYIRFPLKEELIPVAEHIIKISDLSTTDEEIPPPDRMLNPLFTNKTINIDGQLLPPDDPRSILHLELLFNNWIIRTSEILSAEILSACAAWPEIRSYFLKADLISTREIERLRNHINSNNRWSNLVSRPIQLYESKRLFYKFSKNAIEEIIISEPRDDELRSLGWWQQQVALLVETRDALAPQLQTFIKRLGNLMVILLTQVVGRSIGLIGKGIAQGMGRSLTRGKIEQNYTNN